MWWIVVFLFAAILEARYHFLAPPSEPFAVPSREEMGELEALILRLGEWYRVRMMVNGDTGEIRDIQRAPYEVPHQVLT